MNHANVEFVITDVLKNVNQKIILNPFYNIEKSENAQFAMNWFKTFTNHIFEVIKLQNC